MKELQKMKVSGINAEELRIINGGYVDPHPLPDSDPNNPGKDTIISKPIIGDLPTVWW